MLLVIGLVPFDAARAGLRHLGPRQHPVLTPVEPYRPGAIPVVLIHGMGSSERSFQPLIERLRSDPLVASRYQFWTFAYDSCAVLPLSAAALRSELIGLRWQLDPYGRDPALDRMVLVGQSQGGLLAKTAAQESGWTLWDTCFARRPEALDCDPLTRAALVDAFVTHRVPSVARIVYIATPHHGSRGPAAAVGRTKQLLLSADRRDEIGGPLRDLLASGGRGVLAPTLRRDPINAIGNLRWDSPVLEALDRIPLAPDVAAHSIIPQIGTAGRHLQTDGVVRYGSAHVEEVASEVVIPGAHVALRRPSLAVELRRILLIHLDSVGPPP